MAKYEFVNHRNEDFPLPTGFVIEAGRTTKVSEGVVLHGDNQAYLNSLYRSGKVTLQEAKGKTSGQKRTKEKSESELKASEEFTPTEEMSEDGES